MKRKKTYFYIQEIKKAKKNTQKVRGEGGGDC